MSRTSLPYVRSVEVHVRKRVLSVPQPCCERFPPAPSSAPCGRCRRQHVEAAADRVDDDRLYGSSADASLSQLVDVGPTVDDERVLAVGRAVRALVEVERQPVLRRVAEGRLADPRLAEHQEHGVLDGIGSVALMIFTGSLLGGSLRGRG
jgi:hypothetical protein